MNSRNFLSELKRRNVYKSYREHDGDGIGPIRIDPLLIPLHGDPRFEALAKKIVPARKFKGLLK
jgi:hypothetical protein